MNEFIYNFVKTSFDTIFDLPLYKFVILKTRKNILVLANVHHIIIDGKSINLFVKELEKVIDKIKNNLDYKPQYISCEKYIEKEKEYLSSTDAKKMKIIGLKIRKLFI